MPRALAVVLMLATASHARPKREVPFELPQGWQAAPVARTQTNAVPPEELSFELQPPAALSLRATVTLYPGKISDGELESAAAERHAARVKNRVAWGMRAEAGPPHESLRVDSRRAVRWRDRVGGALGQSEQLMTCVVAGGRLACLTTIGPPDARDQAEAAAAHILASLKR